MRPTILISLLTLLLGAAPAQAQPEVADILKKVSKTYKGVSQYDFVAEQTLKEQGDNTPPLHAHVRIAFRAPNQYRLEGMIPGLLSDDSNFEEVVMIHDGSALWFYLPKSNQYGSIPADKLAVDREGSTHTPEATDRVAMEKYRVAADFADAAKFLREDEIEVAGAKVGCYVVSVPEKWPGPYTWWFDKERYHIVREVTADGSTVYTAIKLGEPLPDRLFQFKPPPGGAEGCLAALSGPANEFPTLEVGVRHLVVSRLIREKLNQLRSRSGRYKPKFPALFSRNMLPSRMYRRTICTLRWPV